LLGDASCSDKNTDAIVVGHNNQEVGFNNNSTLHKVKETMPTRRSRRLATSAEGVRSLGNNAGKASEEAFLTLASAAVEAIEYKSRSVASDYGLYPVEITGNGMCHLRALYNVSPVAAKVARERGIKHSQYEEIKSILAKHVDETDGKVFCLRKDDPVLHHWVSLTPERYTDDAKWFRTKDYPKASFLLDLLEMPETIFGGMSSDVTSFDVDAMMNH